MAERYGVTLCVKAHVGTAVYNTPTTLQLMQAIASPAFGIDMDPSHIYRAGENPVKAIAAVMRGSSTCTSATARDASRGRASQRIRPTAAVTSTW